MKIPSGLTLVGLSFVCLVANLAAGEVCSRQEGSNICPIEQSSNPSECFRAAVFEHNRNDTAYYGQRVKDNLDLYAKAARIAANNGAKVMVFPENGIGDFPSNSMDDLEEIPDPDQLAAGSDNPCLQPENFNGNDILARLSCIARENKLYMIANYNTKQSCHSGEKVGESRCPVRGFFNLNTNVVFDPEGRFIKRYRKLNLFQEALLGVNHAPSVEEAYFDTPYGRFGIFTCFDMVFKWPAVSLIEKHQIDTVLFPTFWHDEAPIFTAPLAQDGWSRGYQVNLLAANLLKPELGAVGSGIYSGQDAVFTTVDSQTGKLMIANVASRPARGDKKCAQGFDPVVIKIDSGFPVQQYSHNNYELEASDESFILQTPELSDTFCSGKVCCKVDLKIREPVSKESLSKLILIVRDHNRRGPFNFYEQVCLIGTLSRPYRASRSIKFAQEPLVAFERLSLEATFESRYVIPVAGSSLTSPIDRNDHQFECSQTADQDGLFKCKHTYSAKQHSKSGEKIYSFGLYGRMYGRDKMPPGWIVAND